MNAALVRLNLTWALVLLLAWPGHAQDKDKDKDKAPPPEDVQIKKKEKDQAPPKKEGDYREFFKPPQSVEEFWDAITFELDVGKYDLAAKQLHGLMALKPKGEDLFRIEESAGLEGLLRLQKVPKWSADEKVDIQAKKDVAEFLDILARYHTDSKRIAKFIANLNGEPDERSYAIREIVRAGAPAVPPLITAIREANGAERDNLVSVLPKLDRVAVPPLLAALDIPDNALRLELLNTFRKRLEKSAVPFLWHLWGSEKNPETVRAKAGELLSYLLATDVAKLPPAKVALSQLAERYYYHQVRFPTPDSVVVWRWDAKALISGWGGSETLNANKAEEYYGLLAARQALDLDPSYEPAQITFLSLALDKAGGKGESVKLLVNTVNPELAIKVLEKGLGDRRQNVVLGTIKALGEMAAVPAARGRANSQPVLVRALYYPERRVQLAAAESLIRIPNKSSPPSVARIVEILRRSAAAEPEEKGKTKVLVGYFSDAVAQEISGAVEKAGFQPIRVKTGREAAMRLGEAADIDVLLLDSALPNPGLKPLLAQLHADVNVGHLPIVIAAPREGIEALRRHLEGYRNVSIIGAGDALDVETLKRVLKESNPDKAAQPLSEAERHEQVEKSLQLLAQLRQSGLQTSALEPAGDVLVNALHYPKLGNDTIKGVLDSVGAIPGQKAQRELAAFLEDSKQPAVLRLLAAKQLVSHVQQNGLLLNQSQIDAVVSVYKAKDTEAKLREGIAPFLGSLRPDARRTGERLIEFNPLEKTPPQAPKEK